MTLDGNRQSGCNVETPSNLSYAVVFYDDVEGDDALCALGGKARLSLSPLGGAEAAVGVRMGDTAIAMPEPPPGTYELAVAASRATPRSVPPDAASAGASAMVIADGLQGLALAPAAACGTGVAVPCDASSSPPLYMPVMAFPFSRDGVGVHTGVAAAPAAEAEA